VYEASKKKPGCGPLVKHKTPVVGRDEPAPEVVASRLRTSVKRPVESAHQKSVKNTTAETCTDARAKGKQLVTQGSNRTSHTHVGDNRVKKKGDQHNRSLNAGPRKKRCPGHAERGGRRNAGFLLFPKSPAKKPCRGDTPLPTPEAHWSSTRRGLYTKRDLRHTAPCQKARPKGQRQEEEVLVGGLVRVGPHPPNAAHLTVGHNADNKIATSRGGHARSSNPKQLSKKRPLQRGEPWTRSFRKLGSVPKEGGTPTSSQARSNFKHEGRSVTRKKGNWKQIHQGGRATKPDSLCVQPKKEHAGGNEFQT